ncbi:hypothetical protein BGX27_009701 [Mortierella sp. AM989]|nr:hypothetical protein BGX27_009701 [Mortierella sp. AM989]
MSFPALSTRLFPTIRSQAMARFAAPATSSFARHYATKLFTKDHEWVEIEDGIATVGITNHAQKQLGDIVFVELPIVERTVEKKETFAVIESVKAVSEVFAPLSGEVIEINARLADEPEAINISPEADGWLCKLKVTNNDEVKELLSEEQYRDIASLE